MSYLAARSHHLATRKWTVVRHEEEKETAKRRRIPGTMGDLIGEMQGDGGF